MRKKRVIQPGKCCHLVSRVAHRAYFLDDGEKGRFVDLLRRVEFFCCVKVLAYCCMSNHIHVFMYLEGERELSKDEILARVNVLYRGSRLEETLGEWKALKGESDEEKARFGGSGVGSDFGKLLAAYRRRMFNPSEFMKTLKQNMTMSFNSRRDHTGTIWEGRFYDKRSNPDAKSMSAQAAYVDCNPAEAGICRDPAEYKWCSWAAAVAGDEHARDMYRFVYGGVADEWREIARIHRAARRLKFLASGEKSRGEIAAELGISSQPWLSRAYLSPLIERGYIAQTLPKKPKSPLQRYRLSRRGRSEVV